MVASVYIETTIPSYLAGRPSRDLVTAAHQQVTFEWWHTRRHEFRLFVSELVLQEAALGDSEVARRRLTYLEGVPSVAITSNAQGLAISLVGSGLLPGKAVADALHIAVAAVHHIDYLLTWNIRHLANATTRRRIDALCVASGFPPPVLCTPEELMEG